MVAKAFTDAKIRITAEDKTKAAFNTISKSIKGVAGAVFSLKSAVISAAGIGGMGMLVKSSLDAADQLAKTSDRLGIATESLASLRHAANLAGMENSVLDKSLEKMNINLAKAREGSGEAAKSVEALGLSAHTLAMMPTDQALGTLADAMKDVENAADRAKIAQDIFGRSGIEMINLLDGGSKALSDAATEAKQLGIAISRVDAAKIEAANDAMHRVQQSVKGVGMQIAVNLAPYIQAMSNYFLDSAKSANAWRDQILKAVEYSMVAVGKFIDVIQGVRFAWYAAQLAFSSMAEIVMVGIEKLASPIIKLLSIIPGLGISYEETMGKIQAANVAVAEQSDELMGKMEEIAFSGSAGDRARQMFEEISVAAEVAAVEIADRQAERQAAQRTALQEHLDTTVLQHKESSEKIIENKKRELTALEKFNKMSYMGQTKFVVGEVEKMTRGVAQQNKAMFEINKVAGIANAVINAHLAASNALGNYPYPLSIVMAGLAYASGLAQVQAIRSASFTGGGGGSAPSLAGGSGGGSPVYDPNQGGGGTVNSIPQEPERKDITVELNGLGYSKENVRELIAAINEETGDGVELRATA